VRARYYGASSERLVIALALVFADCSSDSSGGTTQAPSDAATDGDAQAADATTDGDAQAADGGDADTDAGDSCGPLGPTFARCAQNPLYTAGKAHADGRLELFVADPSVMFDDDEGKWKAWWQSPLATDYLAPDPGTAILYAESTDGLHWTVQEEPVLAAHGNPADWDYDRLETPSVIKVPSNPPDRRYVLYYSGGNFAATPSSVPGYVWYQIGVAFSSDGRSFQRLPASESPYAGKTTPYQNIAGLLLMGRDAFPTMTGVADGLVADPEVLMIGNTWHLYFSSMPVDAASTPLAFGVSHATSNDGIHWTPSQNNPVLSGAMQPSVVWNAATSKVELFYNGDSDAEKAAAPSQFNVSLHVSHASSNDGDAFTASNPTHIFDWDASYPYEAYAWLTGADVVLRPDGYWLFYTGFSSQNPPANFYVPASNSWCATAGSACSCFAADAGTETCLLPSVVTLNLARRTAS